MLLFCLSYSRDERSKYKTKGSVHLDVPIILMCKVLFFIFNERLGRRAPDKNPLFPPIYIEHSDKVFNLFSTFRLRAYSTGDETRMNLSCDPVSYAPDGFENSSIIFISQFFSQIFYMNIDDIA